MDDGSSPGRERGSQGAGLAPGSVCSAQASGGLCFDRTILVLYNDYLNGPGVEGIHSHAGDFPRVFGGGMRMKEFDAGRCP